MKTVDDGSPALIHCSERLFRVGIDAHRRSWPAWLSDAVAKFRADVGSRTYPCHFGRHAVQVGEVFGTWVQRGEDAAGLGKDLRAFLDATRPFPKRRLVLAAFLEPEPVERGHEWYSERFWSLLAQLRARDEVPWPAEFPASPGDSKWEFCFGGTAMFVFAAAPSHRDRRSRRLGSGMVMMFQPRNVFQGIEGGTPQGNAARRVIRTRLLAWDAQPPHPLLGEYGDPSNFEWKQYFIADDASQPAGLCPLDPARDLCLHELVSEQARRSPDATAIIAGPNVIDYGTLERAANRLAAQLVEKGISPDERVGVMADRSVETVLTLLAVLKSGAAYVPIDPTYPEARRAYIVEDSGVNVVVAPRRLVATVPVGPRWVLLSDEPPGADAHSVGPPATRVRPDNLAYLIYTSGSTGTPKGVAVSHRQIVHSTLAQYAVQRPWPEAFLMSISFSFDASAVGVYWTLSAGGCLILPTDDAHRDPQRLRALIEQFAVTHTDCTPSLYDLVLGEDPTQLRTLRCVQVGGETCPVGLALRHQRLLPDCTFENNYGPTEATIWSTTNVLKPGTPIQGGTVPIGREIPGARTYLLDASLRPVALGQPGELFVGGAGVARGYHGRPAETAERFLPDPFAARPGRRMYRTGDVVRQLADCSLDFVGRRDAQVKLRGYRIELGEIEAALQTHGDVAKAVVELRDIAGESILVAYVQLRNGRRGTDIALTSHLAPLLPEHMVPRRYVWVEAWPRTTNGKLDRANLPDPRPLTPGEQVVTGRPSVKEGVPAR